MKFSATYLDKKNKRHRITVDVKSPYKAKKAIYDAVGYKCALVGEPLIVDDDTPVGSVPFVSQSRGVETLKAAANVAYGRFGG